MPRQILKALLDRIKARKRTEQGKMRRPDMRRDQHAVRAGLQQNLKQIPAVQAENRSAVGMDITDPLKAQRKRISRSEARQQDHIMHFSRFTVLFIDRADLAGKHKTRFILAAGGRRCKPCSILQRVESFFGRFKQFVQFLPPAGMCKIARSDEPDPLPPRPCVEMRRIGVTARSHGVF
ncbi:unknown [Clostridium sp. CAG:1024]|nr:unknown [Clostridium sp. CAG:1024]